MGVSARFDVRFYMAGSRWPTNPFRFRGPGTLEVQDDFVIVRGSRQRSFRLPQRCEERLRMADIVNAYDNGQDVWFDVLGVDEDVTVGFSVADAATAQRIVALLPARQTERFRQEHEENAVFHDRIDYWTPSTPVIWGLLAANVGLFALMWLARRHYEAALVGPMRRMFALYPAAADASLQASLLRDWGANIGRLTLGQGEYWRLVSSMFLHGSIWHRASTCWRCGRSARSPSASSAARALPACTCWPASAAACRACCGACCGMRRSAAWARPAPSSASSAACSPSSRARTAACRRRSLPNCAAHCCPSCCSACGWGLCIRTRTMPRISVG
nr:rhomboid family intramembrane serine protease [Massilia sp. Se16.2.3]